MREKEKYLHDQKLYQSFQLEKRTQRTRVANLRGVRKQFTIAIYI